MIKQALMKKIPVDSEGFTLVELLIVVAIIAILAAIAIPNFQRYTERANRASMLSDAKHIANMLEIYFTDKNTYVTAVTAVGPGPASASLDGGTEYIVRVGKNNTVNLVETVSTYSIAVSNPGAGVGMSPITFAVTGPGITSCTWGDGSSC
jgi:prepilin-type N-terminal cleavage/methylation domain-containing protein